MGGWVWSEWRGEELQLRWSLLCTTNHRYWSDDYGEDDREYGSIRGAWRRCIELEETGRNDFEGLDGTYWGLGSDEV